MICGMGPRLTPAARSLLARQRGVIGDWQARDVGLSRERLRRACRSGWQQVSPHVFADREGDISVDQMRVVAVLESGPGSLLAGRSALAEAGWRGSDDGYVDVLVPRGRRRRAPGAPAWLRAHHPRDEPPGQGDPARTSAARAAIDAAAWARGPRAVLVVLASTAQQRLATPRRMRAELARWPRMRNAALIREVLDELDAGVTSSAEAAFRRECRRRGLPEPRMQTRRRDATGGARFTDAEFDLPDGRLLIVEIDGIGHLGVAEWHADIARQNGLVVTTGALVLRVPGWAVRHDPDPFFENLQGFFTGSW